MQTLNFNTYTRFLKWFDVSTPVFSTRLSMIICSFLAVFGIIIGITQVSLAVQINGLIAAIDVLNSFIFLTAVNHSVKSPDYIYNYGYGKYESLSILAGAGLLLIVLGYALYEAALSFWHPEVQTGNYYFLLSFSFGSLALMMIMYRVQKKMSKKYKMPIIDYDAAIWKIDSYIEMGVLSNLIVGAGLKYFGMGHTASLLDSITAVLLLIFALKVPIEGSRNALNQLLDKTVSDEIQFKLLAVVSENINKMCEFKRVHTRQSGKDIFIELDIVLPYDYTVKQKYDMEKEIRNRILEEYPTSIPRVYAIACESNCDHNGQTTCPVKVALLNRENIKNNV